jgi:hypothetical protein
MIDNMITTFLLTGSVEYESVVPNLRIEVE